MNAIDNVTLEKLEAQLAYTQKTLSELNEIVTAQAREIDLLKGEVRLLGQQMLQLTGRETRTG